MTAIRTLHRGWRDSLVDLIGSARHELVIVAPYITSEGTTTISSHVSATVRDSGRLEIVTDLSPAHVCDSSLDADALAGLVSANQRCAIWHVPALHAKVYISDRERAIVTSGNLTAGAFYRNAEYGVEISSADLVGRIRADIAEFRAMGATVSTEAMRRYAEVVSSVRRTYAHQQDRVSPRLRQAFNQAVQAAEIELIRLRLAGGAMHTVFARTIRILLARHGSLPTTIIHNLINQLHPDLCDDTVDRVIDGKSYGKKWKHAVRTAQQQLKKRGIVEYDGRVWRLRMDRQESSAK